MAIGPEVIPPTSSAGNDAVRQFPKWFVYGGLILAVLAVVGILKMLLPLILMGLLLSFIWTKARNY